MDCRSCLIQLFQRPISFLVSIGSSYDHSSISMLVITGWLDLVGYELVCASWTVIIWVPYPSLRVTLNCLKSVKCLILLIDVWEVNWLMRGHVGFDFLIRQKLSLHTICVNIWQVMDDVFAKIRCNLLLLLLSVMVCCFI